MVSSTEHTASTIETSTKPTSMYIVEKPNVDGVCIRDYKWLHIMHFHSFTPGDNPIPLSTRMSKFAV